MLYLLSTLLIFGLIQSLLELKKDNRTEVSNTNHSDKKSRKKNGKWGIERILSIVYILCFFVGLTVIILQNQESSESIKSIKNISLSVSKIDSNFPKVIKQLNKSFEETSQLIKTTDSMNKNTVNLIKIRDSLSVQTKLINNKLSEQLDIDKQTLKEKEAKIALFDYDIKWNKEDSNFTVLDVCIENVGKRNAILDSEKGYVVFFSKEKKVFAYYPIPGNTNPSILPPYNDVDQMTYCFYSWGIKNFNSIKAKTDFAVVCSQIKYKDALTEIQEVNHFYSGWRPSWKSFGGPRDWQIDLAKQWANDNKILN